MASFRLPNVADIPQTCRLLFVALVLPESRLPGVTAASSSSPAGATDPALSGRRRSAPSGGSEPHAVGSVGATDLVEKYLEYVRVEKRLAARTVELYALDLLKLQEYAAKVPVALTEVRNAHIRRWVAQMHGGGRSGRGIALIMSGWRGFYVWLGRQGLVASNPVQDVRAPKAPKPL
ncbi:MAG: site-specific integrase, partial [Burkholderiaceae bacterium]|nr:site-specific integrase [Burkholderiaceae bacterium]